MINHYVFDFPITKTKKQITRKLLLQKCIKERLVKGKYNVIPVRNTQANTGNSSCTKLVIICVVKNGQAYENLL